MPPRKKGKKKAKAKSKAKPPAAQKKKPEKWDMNMFKPRPKKRVADESVAPKAKKPKPAKSKEISEDGTKRHHTHGTLFVQNALNKFPWLREEMQVCCVLDAVCGTPPRLTR